MSEAMQVSEEQGRADDLPLRPRERRTASRTLISRAVDRMLPWLAATSERLAALRRAVVATKAGRWVAAHRQLAFVAGAGLFSVLVIGGGITLAAAAAGGGDPRGPGTFGGSEASQLVESDGRATPNSPPTPQPYRVPPTVTPAPLPSDPPNDTLDDAETDTVVEPTPPPVEETDDHPGQGKGPKKPR